MDFVQKSSFFLFAFFTEILSENNVFDIVEKKRMILSGKNSSFKNGHKKDIFERGWSMTLSKTHNFYYRCFFLKLCNKRSFFDIYETKE